MKKDLHLYILSIIDHSKYYGINIFNLHANQIKSKIYVKL